MKKLSTQFWDNLTQNYNNNLQESIFYQINNLGTIQNDLQIKELLGDWPEVKKRKSILKEIAQLVSQELQIKEPPKLCYYSRNDRVAGSFYPKVNIIDINERFWGDEAFILNTIAHELAHAKQYEITKAKLKTEIQWETWEEEFNTKFSNHDFIERITFLIIGEADINEKLLYVINGPTESTKRLDSYLYYEMSIEKVAREYANFKVERVYF